MKNPSIQVKGSTRASKKACALGVVFPLYVLPPSPPSLSRQIYMAVVLGKLPHIYQTKALPFNSMYLPQCMQAHTPNTYTYFRSHTKNRSHAKNLLGSRSPRSNHLLRPLHRPPPRYHPRTHKGRRRLCPFQGQNCSSQMGKDHLCTTQDCSPVPVGFHSPPPGIDLQSRRQGYRQDYGRWQIWRNSDDL